MTHAAHLIGGRWGCLLLALLAAVLLGVHATHLPILADGHAARAGEPGYTCAPDGGMRGGRGPASGGAHAADSAGQTLGPVLPLGALHPASDGTRCPAETLAAVPRTAFSLLLVLGIELLVVVVLANGRPNRSTLLPPPPAHRRRALLQVYLV